MDPTIDDGANAELQRRRALSDLADGRANAKQVELLLADWEQDESLRSDWQAMHLIGAALRSPELAAPAQSGEALLAGLRERIAREPVPLHHRSWSQWLPAMGVAASFVMMALLLPILPMHTAQNQLAAAPARSEPNLANALVETPVSHALDGTPSFVQTIVAPDQPGLLPESPPQQRLLRTEANPLAHAASANSP